MTETQSYDKSAFAQSAEKPLSPEDLAIQQLVDKIMKTSYIKHLPDAVDIFRSGLVIIASASEAKFKGKWGSVNRRRFIRAFRVDKRNNAEDPFCKFKAGIETAAGIDNVRSTRLVNGAIDSIIKLHETPKKGWNTEQLTPAYMATRNTQGNPLLRADFSFTEQPAFKLQTSE